LSNIVDDSYTSQSGVTRRKVHSLNPSESMMSSISSFQKGLIMKSSSGKFSKVFIADVQILGSAFFFGIGFLGQRAVMVRKEGGQILI
jgi:hypothetical protein